MKKKPCLHRFNGEESVFYVAVGANGALFGKDDTATAYLVSFINLLQRVQSCNDNHLLLGANCEEDHVLMKSYSSHLASEMREIEGKTLATPQEAVLTRIVTSESLLCILPLSLFPSWESGKCSYQMLLTWTQKGSSWCNYICPSLIPPQDLLEHQIITCFWACFKL